MMPGVVAIEVLLLFTTRRMCKDVLYSWQKQNPRVTNVEAVTGEWTT